MTERKQNEFELEDLEKPLSVEDQKKTAGGVPTLLFKKPLILEIQTNRNLTRENTVESVSLDKSEAQLSGSLFDTLKKGL